MHIKGANAVWLDPVAVLNRGYSQYQVSYSQYYSRSSFGNLNSSAFSSSSAGGLAGSEGKTSYVPNEKEVLAELRRRESRSAIQNAHSLFFAIRPTLISSKVTLDKHGRSSQSSQLLTTGDSGTNSAASKEAEVDFVRLAELWQAPLYELNRLRKSPDSAESDARWCLEMESRATQLFGSFVEHDEEEVLAECAGCTFILPRHCRFLTVRFRRQADLFLSFASLDPSEVYAEFRVWLTESSGDLYSCSVWKIAL